MKLKDFISTPEGSVVSQAEWSRRVGVTRGYFSQLVQGEKQPSLQVAYDIEIATNGAVRMQDWIEGRGGGADDSGLRGSDPETVEEATAE